MNLLGPHVLSTLLKLMDIKWQNNMCNIYNNHNGSMVIMDEIPMELSAHCFHYSHTQLMGN